MASTLVDQGISVDFIGSDELDNLAASDATCDLLEPAWRSKVNVSLRRKVARSAYYARLITYALKAEPEIFHILWNNKFELIDRTLLMLYYKIMGKRLVLTAHNVNARKRDGGDSLLNRLSLRIQYSLSNHILVHSERMKTELVSGFCLPENKVSVIPFGINNTVPDTVLSTAEAKRQLGVNKHEKTLLFFGNIAPYKGLDST